MKRLIRQYTDEIAIGAGRDSLSDSVSENFHPDDVPISECVAYLKGFCVRSKNLFFWKAKFRFLFVLTDPLFCTHKIICFFSDLKDPSADDLIELARVELRRSEDLQEEGRLQDDEIRKRLSQLTDAPKGNTSIYLFQFLTRLQMNRYAVYFRIC